MAKRKKSNVAVYHRPVRINIGMILFLFIVIYIAAQFLFYLNKEHISIYEVVSTTMSDDNTIMGMALRNEEVYYADKSGYVNFYVNEGGRTAVNDVIYTIDETGNVYTQLTESGKQDTGSPERTAAIQDMLSRHYKDSSLSFESVYSLKESIMTEVYKTSGASMLSSLNQVLKTYGDGNNFHVKRADESGIVAFYTDGYENIQREEIRYEDFNAEIKPYQRITVNNSALVEEGAAVYKLIPSETWSILLPVTQEQFAKLADRDQVSITFRKDGVEANAAVSVFQNNGEYFAELTLSRYMVRYLNQRFVEVTLSLKEIEGLKIPQTSIVEKSFFKVPLEYFTEGGNSNSDGLVRETYTEDGEVVYTYYGTDIYYKDDTYAYIAMDAELKAGDRIRKTDSTDTFILAESATLKGVYNANKGYAVFRRIEPLFENEEYCIVADNTQYGLSEYDHIILQGELAVNQALIY